MKSVATVLLLCIVARVGVAAPATRSDFIRTSDGIRIHYLEAGAGKPIVFIPGWRMPAWIWRKQIDALSGHYRVIAVDPRSQGDSDKPSYGHLPETRARDYKELIDQLRLRRPVLVAWSMGCGELLSYVEQFGEEDLGGMVLVDGMIPANRNPSVVSVLTGWTRLLQQDRKKEAEIFVRSMYTKPEPEAYLQKVMQASMLTPTDTTVALIYNMLAVTDFSKAFARIDRPLIFAYEPALRPHADYLKETLGDKIQLEQFDGDGHALFVDDPFKFNRMIEQFMQRLPQ